mgnify:CR=1 FL=1
MSNQKIGTVEAIMMILAIVVSHSSIPSKEHLIFYEIS